MYRAGRLVVIDMVPFFVLENGYYVSGATRYVRVNHRDAVRQQSLRQSQVTMNRFSLRVAKCSEITDISPETSSSAG
jgi:hypothetical protein